MSRRKQVFVDVEDSEYKDLEGRGRAEKKEEKERSYEEEGTEKQGESRRL